MWVDIYVHTKMLIFSFKVVYHISYILQCLGMEEAKRAGVF